MKSTYIFGAATIALALSFSGCGSDSGRLSAQEGPPRLRLGHFPNVTHAPALVGLSEGIVAKEIGDDARLEVKVFNAGPAAMEALLAGEIDLCYVGPSPAINTFLKSNGEALRVVSGVCSGGASLVATATSGIRSVKDLAGKKVATPQLGNTQDVSLRYFLTQAGLKTKDKGGEVEVLPAQNPDILQLFLTNKIDAAWVPEPWATRIVQEAGAVRAIDERELWPNRQFTTTVLIARTEYMKHHPELVEAVARANAEAIAWMKVHPAEAKATTNNELRRLTGKPLPDALLDESWEYMEFTTDPNEASLEAFMRAAAEAGYLRNQAQNLDGLVDLSALKSAKKVAP